MATDEQLRTGQPPTKNPAGCGGCRPISLMLPVGTGYLCSKCGVGRATGPAPTVS